MHGGAGSSCCVHSFHLTTTASLVFHALPLIYELPLLSYDWAPVRVGRATLTALRHRDSGTLPARRKTTPNADTEVAERTSKQCGHIGGRVSPVIHYDALHFTWNDKRIRPPNSTARQDAQCEHTRGYAGGFWRKPTRAQPPKITMERICSE